MINVNIELLTEFENQLDSSNPTSGEIEVKVIGYGEMSAIFLFEEMPELAVKRMPPFYSSQEILEYRSKIDKYCTCLIEKFGVGFNLAQ